MKVQIIQHSFAYIYLVILHNVWCVLELDGEGVHVLFFWYPCVCLYASDHM